MFCSSSSLSVLQPRETFRYQTGFSASPYFVCSLCHSFPMTCFNLSGSNIFCIFPKLTISIITCPSVCKTPSTTRTQHMSLVLKDSKQTMFYSLKEELPIYMHKKTISWCTFRDPHFANMCGQLKRGLTSSAQQSDSWCIYTTKYQPPTTASQSRKNS